MVDHLEGSGQFSLAQTGVHLVLFALKTSLAAAGAQSVWQNLRYMSRPPTDNPPPAKKPSTFSVDRVWTWAYFVMNVIDILKTVQTGGTTSEHIHHAATAWGYFLNAIFGSPRTMALARMSLVGEVCCC